MRYHIGRDGRKFGPYSESELREQIASGQVLSGDAVWHEGMPAWKPVASLFPDAPVSPPALPAAGVASPVKGGNTGLVLGCVNLVAWFIPLFGLPLSIWGIIASLKARQRGVGTRATVGLVLNLVALVLVIANAAIGAYLGATGQHPLLK